MQKKIKYAIIIACVSIIAVIISVAAVLYPNAEVVFSGISMVAGGDNTTQGFVDITLKDINTTGLSFCLQYDTSKIELSKVGDNTKIENPVSGMIGSMNYYVGNEFFEQNEENFPLATSFKTGSVVMPGLPLIGAADADNGFIMMNFIPKAPPENPVDPSQYSKYIDTIPIDDYDEMPAIMTDNTSGVSLGRISFKIKDPSSFAKLTQDELKNVIKIAPFKSMTGEDTTSEEGIILSYVDNDNNVVIDPDASRAIKYKFKIVPEIKEIVPLKSLITVNAYELYKNGTPQDLIDYLNDNASVLRLIYTDGSEVPEIFHWSAQDSNASTIVTYNPKQGTYDIEQPYNPADNNSAIIKITINVEEVKLNGYEVNDETITYLYNPPSDFEPKFPENLNELNLPAKARPILSPFILNGAIADVDVGDYTLDGETNPLTELPGGFNSGNPQKYKIYGTVSDDIATNNPWLTVTDNPKVTVYRNVAVNQSDIPKKLVVLNSSTNSDGVLTIEVGYEGGASISEGTEFIIRLPDGNILDTSTWSSSEYEVIISGGTATITVNPNINDPDQQNAAQLINLGGRAGQFGIAEADTSAVNRLPLGPETLFSPNARDNVYLQELYEFDYSDELSAMMIVKAGQELPTTVNLPWLHNIDITYDGMDGSEPGYLKTFTVDNWDVKDGDIFTIGSVVTVEGNLVDTYYVNQGTVKNANPANPSKVRIKYVVTENDGLDAIDTIPDFEFDTKQLGYGVGDLQTKSFTIKNKGPNNIYGLSVTISLSSENNSEAFIVTQEPISILNTGESVDFDITPKLGLPLGVYTSTVTIHSNNEGTSPLGSFAVKFEVTDLPVHNIKLTSNDENLGKAKTDTDKYTAILNSTVKIIAIPEPDCEFVQWVVRKGSVTLANSNDAETTFEMPDEDVEIEAEFKETLAAKVRLENLIVKDEELNNYQLHKLNLTDNSWIATSFEPSKFEYYVAVPNDKEKVKLWFKPKTEVESATFEVKYTHGTTVDDPINETKDNTDSYHKTDSFEIELDSNNMPMDNTVVIKMTYEDTTGAFGGGTATKEYVVHIFRKLAQSQMAEFNYGNSPYGLIMNDSTILEADKQTTKDEFVDKYTFIGSAPANGFVNVRYSPKAWTGGINYDLSDYSLFVINDSSFVDPGVKTIRNSLGNAVTDYTKSVVVNELAPAQMSAQDATIDDFKAISKVTIPLPNSGNIVQLQSRRIRPDVYQIVYNFTDFDGSTTSVSKPLIVLSKIGDYTIDKNTDTIDIEKNLNRFSSAIPKDTNVDDYSVGGKVYKYRICDVNKDENVNAIDANNIRANSLKEFYKNTQGGGG